MKIAILGTENSHAYEFCKLIRNMPKYADIQLVGVYGYDAAANKRLLDEGLTARVADNPQDFLGQVDGILITARHGDLHHAYAMPYLKQGVAAFIDKPFTVDLAKTEEMVSAAKETGALLCGGSSLKFLDEFAPLRRFLKGRTPVGGYVAAPVSMVNEYGGFYFYSQHLTECLISIFGDGVHSVQARRPQAEENRVSMVFDYGSFDVTAQYTDAYTYTATVLCKEGGLTASVSDVAYCYERELDEFVQMVESGKMPRDYDALVFPSRLLHAIETAYLTGQEVQVTR